jgi:magnesium chelatase family protein
MSFSKVHSAQTHLLKAHIIDIETDISRGLHSFSIVGLPDKGVEESKDRVSAALKNSGFTSPKSKNEKITVSLAPADLKKEGPAFDVGVAFGYLLAGEEIDFDPKEIIFLGELSLDGKVRRISGILPLVVEAKNKGFKSVFVPKENALEAALVRGIDIYPVTTLTQIINHLGENKEIKRVLIEKQPVTEILLESEESKIDFDDVEGNETAKRGLLIAAAGGHNIALFGPPGTGKTMLAKAFRSILPPLSFDEALEVTAIHSVAGTLKGSYMTHPPIRSPHHTASYVSLVGGGAIPKPGEITLAHKGVLFLDEFPEFDKRVIETLRQPLEEKVVSVSRARGSAHFPARFILVAALNPCPCGNFGIEGKACTCSPQNILRYQRKISGPIADRIDMWIEVSKVDHEKIIRKRERKNTTGDIRDQVLKARNEQSKRFEKGETKLNSDMSARDIQNFFEIEEKAEKTLERAAKTLDLSDRSCHKVMKLARTIADLDGKKIVDEKSILEALQYRQKKTEI